MNPQLSQLNALGQGFDIFGTMNVEQGIIRPLFDTSKAEMEPTQFLGQTYNVPAFISLTEDTNGYHSGGTYTSREAVQHSFAAQAGIKASYAGIFSAQFNAAYSKESQSSNEYDYSYRNSYSQVGVATIQTDSKYYSDDFIRAIAALPADINSSANLHEYFEFFNNYGAYYLSKVILGSASQFYVAVNKSSSLSVQDISASFSASYHGLFVSGSVSASMQKKDAWQSFSKNASANLTHFGGDPAKAAKFLNLVLETFPDASPECAAAYNDWMDSVDTDVAPVDFAVNGIWNLCGEKSHVVYQAWQQYYRHHRPTLTIQTSTMATEKYIWQDDFSEVGSVPVKHGPVQLPTIKIDTLDLSLNETPANPRGLQVAVLDGSKDITQQEAKLFNKIYSFGLQPMGPPSGGPEAQMYTQIMDDLRVENFMEKGNILILASFNFLTPTSFPYNKSFRQFLERWGVSPDEGYFSDNEEDVASSANDLLANLIIVGVSGSEPGSAVQFPVNFDSNNVVGYYDSSASPDEDGQRYLDSLQLVIYPDQSVGGYRLGDGKFS